MKRTLGTCYYPEHWPESQWATDAQNMKAAGLTWIRIGEFAWSRIEPAPERFDWGWLDRAIDTLGAAGLKVVLGTPTATPPRWMLTRHPDMLAIDENGQARKFGSRRHYCFSHEGYRAEAVRIATKLGARYGRNPHVAAWQIDNEYGCHDTTISFSAAALGAFLVWLKARYNTVDALNKAWGNVFWSMEYADFNEIDLPNQTVTDPNPAHLMAFRRFSSDQVVAFNRAQVEALRGLTDAPLSHNYMGRITDFDHFDLGTDLDIAAWDSYPLGFLEDRVGASADRQRAYARQGDPDFQAFHHDLYRAVGKGRLWIMEQQPGPVNWAPHNPAPLAGMVRLWTWEAFAHGAETVCYFRWRQAPFAQEQMHAGLMRPDDQPSKGLTEAQAAAREITEAPDVQTLKSPVAILFDYQAEWMWQIQPHGRGLDYFGLVFECYCAARALGLSVDILPTQGADLSGYGLVLAPGLMHMSEALKERLARLVKAGREVILGPRTGARDVDMCTPVPLPPAFPDLPVTVAAVESLRPDMPLPLENDGAFTGYREFLEGDATVVSRTNDGEPAVVTHGTLTYIAGWPDALAWRNILSRACETACISTWHLPDGLRRRETAGETFWFNYTTSSIQFEGRQIEAADYLREITGQA